MCVARYLSFLIVFYSSIAFATTFQKASLVQIINQADSAAEVELKSKKTFMNKMGIIQTEYSFLVLENYNVNESDLELDLLKITMVGGSYEGVTSFIEGAPEFKIGEKSFLLLKKIESKIYLSNFTLGKFKIETSNGEIYYSSVVFPEDAELGKIKKEKMIELVKQKFNITLKSHETKKANKTYTHYTPVKSSSLEIAPTDYRKPAQEISEPDVSLGLSAMWIYFFLVLGLGGGIWWQLCKGARD